jgi:hypothetical protein
VSKGKAITPAMLSLAVAIATAGSARGQQEAPRPAVRVGATQKICQLTGDTDWETGKPTAARTFTNFGLEAVDLGYPVEHNGKLILLFGDSWPPPHGGGVVGEAIPDDGVGVVTRTELPDSESCLGLVVHSKLENGRKKFDPAAIAGPVKVKQGFFNVPSGGVTAQGALFGFFWTDHCSAPNPVRPAPDNPLERPAATANCPETDDRNSIGKGLLARSNDDGHTFNGVVATPPGFVYSTAVNANLFGQELPEDQRLGIIIFGVPRYRASVPYLAHASAATFADPATWQFFAGLTSEGKPKWVPRAAWKASPENQIYTPRDNIGYNVGEFSITYNRPLRMWLMMYGGVSVRLAPAPWGPWSAPTVILSGEDHPGCKLVMTPAGCGDRRDFWPGNKRGANFQPGGFYAPYVMNRYTRPGEGPRTATLYWVLSTWNPYQVSVMRTTIQAPGAPGDGPDRGQTSQPRGKEAQ